MNAKPSTAPLSSDTTSHAAHGAEVRTDTATARQAVRKSVCWIVMLLVLIALSGCGGGDGGDSGVPIGGNSPQPLPATPAPTALTISGTPAAQVQIDTLYQFTPSVQGTNGAALVFSVTHAPTWTTFDPTTGRLSGTPGNGDIGVHGGIVISVSDGTRQASLGAFEIEVTGPATHSVTLSWQAPVERVDGSPLVGLAGFKILYGTQPGSLNTQIDLPNPGLSRYVVENLSSGTWYFAMTAYDAAGLESNRSSTVQAMLN